MNKAILLLGSNIEPESNIMKALQILGQKTKIIKVSSIYHTKAVGSDGPDFLNQAVSIETDLDKDDIKNKLILFIEINLGRVRTEDKYAPRTIDVDLILYNSDILDQNVWKYKFAALPVSELNPHLINPDDGRKLSDIIDCLN